MSGNNVPQLELAAMPAQALGTPEAASAAPLHLAAHQVAQGEDLGIGDGVVDERALAGPAHEAVAVEVLRWRDRLACCRPVASTSAFTCSRPCRNRSRIRSRAGSASTLKLLGDGVERRQGTSTPPSCRPQREVGGVPGLDAADQVASRRHARAGAAATRRWPSRPPARHCTHQGPIGGQFGKTGGQIAERDVRCPLDVAIPPLRRAADVDELDVAPGGDARPGRRP